MLPALDRPRVLDVGCGTGAPTLELAKLCDGEITAMDTNKQALDELVKTIEREGLSDRVHVVNRSMRKIDFPDASFDIVWAEGSIHVIGFETGLRDWHRLIASNGYLVVHEATWLRPDPPRELADSPRLSLPGIRTAPQYIEVISRQRYELIGHFLLPEDVWWTDYFGPLENRIHTLRKKYAADPDALTVLDNEQRDVDLYKRCAAWYGSAFYLMRRR
jgi:SAM-dependent methyltransferase